MVIKSGTCLENFWKAFSGLMSAEVCSWQKVEAVLYGMHASAYNEKRCMVKCYALMARCAIDCAIRSDGRGRVSTADHASHSLSSCASPAGIAAPSPTCLTAA